LDKVNITPLIIGPTTVVDKNHPFTFFKLDPIKTSINIGFYDFRPTIHEDGYYNKAIEKKAKDLGAQKLLYSSSYYTEKEFWEIYDKKTYDKLKRKYDSKNKLRSWYNKVVRSL